MTKIDEIENQIDAIRNRAMWLENTTADDPEISMHIAACLDSFARDIGDDLHLLRCSTGAFAACHEAGLDPLDHAVMHKAFQDNHSLAANFVFFTHEAAALVKQWRDYDDLTYRFQDVFNSVDAWLAAAQ